MTSLSGLIASLAMIANLGYAEEMLPIQPRETEVLTISPREFKGDPSKFESQSIIRGSVRPYGTYDAPFGPVKIEVSERQLNFLKTLNQFKTDLDPREIEKEFIGPEILTIVPRLVK